MRADERVEGDEQRELRGVRAQPERRPRAHRCAASGAASGWRRRSPPARPGAGGDVASSACANASASRRPSIASCGGARTRSTRTGWPTAHGRRPTRRSGSGSTHDAVGQLEQPRGSESYSVRAWPRPRLAGDVQVGPADVADQQRVAGEHQPRLARPARAGRRPGRRGAPARGRAWRSRARSVLPSSTTSPSASAWWSNSTPAPAGR